MKKSTGSSRKRIAERRRQARRRRLIYGAVAVVILAIIAVSVIPRPRKSAQPSTQAGIDKAMGSVDAPVLVEEYGDFQ
jgi:NADH:ubiquinone oxidoreductase subunit 6 (subunit J)